MNAGDPIAEGRAIAVKHNGPDGPGFKNAGKLNAYECETCHFYAVTIDREPGVTPFIVRCRNCGGQAQSKMYRVASHLTPTWEWVRPETIDGLDTRTVEHIRNGGLIMRSINPVNIGWSSPFVRRA